MVGQLLNRLPYLIPGTMNLIFSLLSICWPDMGGVAIIREAPLWAPDQYPIYYWTADEFSAEEAYFVNYQGRVGQQPKNWGNPRHGYRCVRE